MSHFRSLALSATLAAFSLVPLAQAQSAATYTDSKYGFSLNYPQGYAVRTDVPNLKVVFVGPRAGGFAPNVNVVVAPAQNATLDQIVQSTLPTLKRSFSGFNVVSQKQVGVAGQAGRELVYTYRQGQLDIRQKQRFVLRNGSVYVLTQSALKSDTQADATLGAILDSFKFGR